MSTPKFSLEVVTPDGIVFQREVVSLRAPGENGQFGVLANHAPMMTGLDTGYIEVKDENASYFLAISGGYAEVLPHKTIILAETAELKENIDVERAQAALRRAQQRLLHPEPEIDIERARLSMARALNRLKVTKL